MNNLTLCHHGIKGMKWGVRRSERQLAAVRGKKQSSGKKKKKLFKVKSKKLVLESQRRSPRLAR